MVAHSKICDVSVIPDFADDAVLVRTLIEYAQQHAQARLVLFAASEEYVHRILSVRDELSQYYIIPYAQKDLGLRISDKPQFYAMCEQYNLPYPRTTVVTLLMILCAISLPNRRQCMELRSLYGSTVGRDYLIM